jgi:peroxiredoxin
MKSFRLLITFVVAALMGSGPASALRAAAVEDEVKEIQERIISKAQSGKASESDLAAELNALSDLCTKYRSQKQVAAQILLVRAQIYEQVIKDREMAFAIYIQIITEYPETAGAMVAAATIEAIQATADDKPPPRERASNQNQNRSGSAPRNASSGSTRNSSPSASSNRSAANNNNAAGGRSGSAPEVGGRFPDFSLQDLDGVPLTLGQFRGQMVLVDFWATSCSECVEEMDNVMAAYRRFHAKGFEIVGISLDRDRAPLKNFIRARTITWPQFFDEGGTVSRRFGITSPGSSFLLDREGKVVAVNLRGYALERMLQKHLEPQI